MTARRELHAATAQAFSPDGAKQVMLAHYRNKRDAAVAPGFEFRPGFIYTQVRAISARINQNFDGWPSGELKKSYRSFLGKPCFVNHQNFDPKKARGKVVASRYVEAGDDKYIETVMEIDAARFPKLAREIIGGGLDSVSMGVEAGFTICSYCGNKAVDVPEFCEHVKYHKGQKLGRIDERTGAVEPVMVYEKCYKLGFFELSYVFDPADETAVVSRVISANHRTSQAPPPGGMGSIPPTDIMPVVDMPTEQPPTEQPSVTMMPTAALERRINRLAYGEVSAPEDIDTLRYDKTDGEFDFTGQDSAPENDDPFQRYTESPRELQPPNLDKTKRLDRDQEQQGLDTDRRVEDIEDVSGANNIQRGELMSSRSARRRRVATRRYADPGMDPSMDPSLDPSLGGGGDPGMDPGLGGGGDLPPDDSSGGGGMSDEELIAEAERDLAQAESDMGGDAPDEGDEYADEGDEGDYGDEGDEGLGDEEPDEDEFGGPPDGDEDDLGARGEEEDLPPWLTEGGGDEEDSGPPPPPSQLQASRYYSNGKTRSSTRNKRRTGEPQMGSLAHRSRTAAAQRPRNHYAADNGHFDGGPYGEDNQGEQEEVFLSQTPGTESVAAPTPGDGTISNTTNSLVARINARNAEQRRDLIAYEQITGRRLNSTDLGAGEYEGFGQTVGSGAQEAGPPEGWWYPGMKGGNRRNAGEHNLTSDIADQAVNPMTGEVGGPASWASDSGSRNDPGAHWIGGSRRRHAEAVESPDQVDPTTQTNDELTGDHFESLGEEPVETQPRDASVRAFRAFDSWLQSTTGKTARQHGNPNFIRRTAARYCQAKGWDPAVMFPTLGNVLREARSSKGTTRRADMRRYADEELDVAAPQDRIDVEAPVANTTDAEAQASQFDLGDFGSNAGDNLADPELSVDSQIWAPGEGEGSVKSSNRKADGITAVRYAEAYIRAGLAPNTSEEKWKIAGLAQTMRLGTIRDRIALLDAVNQTRAASARRTAGVNRGAGSSVPPGFGRRQLTAGQATNSVNDIANDSALFLK